MRQSDLTVDQVIRKLQSGDHRPICFWLNELAVLAQEGDKRAEVKLREYLKSSHREEKYVAYWGLRETKGKDSITQAALELFEKNPLNECMLVPPSRHRN